MDIVTKRMEKVEYSIELPEYGVRMGATVTGTDLSDGRAILFYSDMTSSGSIEVSQMMVDPIMNFLKELQTKEAIRLGLIPDPNLPPEEPMVPATES